VGRFASTVEFYSRFREPYSPEFFRAVAERLGLRGHASLLDVGCGPGPLAIGFARFVKSTVGLDPEPAMIEAARKSAEQAGAQVTFRVGRIEDFAASERFDLVTIGRALHWLDRAPALEVLDHIVSGKGWVAVCRAAIMKTPATSWLKPYQEICRSWSDNPDRRYRLEATNWFAGSRFHKVDTISVAGTRRVSVADLIGRALSKSSTSPAFLGERQAEFVAELTAALTPYSQHGHLEETVASSATIFGAALPTRN
jgi:SAM-dependent methyltransferase